MDMPASYALTERDVYYLNSIDRAIGDVDVRKIGDPVDREYLAHLKTVLPRLDTVRRLGEGPSLADEIICDNHDWLDCLIDMLERRWPG